MLDTIKKYKNWKGRPSLKKTKTGNKPFSKKHLFDGFLNHHEYPAVLLRHPSLIRFVYFWNNLALQRNWAVRNSLKNILIELKKNAAVIDAGCGEGMFIFPYARRFPNTRFIGIDKNRGHIGFCENYSQKTNAKNISFFNENLEDGLPFAEAELLLCIGTLQYIEKDETAISNFYKALKKNGRIIIYTPINGKTTLPVYRHYFNKKKHYEKGQNRQRVYSEKEITDKLENAGFEILNKKYTYGNTGVLAHEIYSLLMMGISNSKWFSVFFFTLLLCFMPIIFILNKMDYSIKKNNGNGLLTIAKK